jgi:hypothetical protein
MKPSHLQDFATEGGPLVVTDIGSASSWKGTDADGPGAILEYMGEATKAFPAALLATKKLGRQKKKFKTLAEARDFEDKLLKALRKAYPKAARHPRYPESPVYYDRGDENERIFSIELEFPNQYGRICSSLKKHVQEIVFDKKTKARGCFIEQEGAGPVLAAVDRDAHVLVVAKTLTNEVRRDELVAAIARTKIPPGDATTTFGDAVVVFPSACAFAQIKGPWPVGANVEDTGRGIEKGVAGPLYVEDQASPVGAFASLPAGSYRISAKNGIELKSGYADIVWFVRTQSGARRRR